MSFQLSSRMFVAVVGLLVPALLSIVALHDLPGATHSRTNKRVETVSAGPLLGYGRVDVDTHVRKMVPAQPGRVKKILVHENEPVDAGTVMVQLEDEPAQLRQRQAQIELREAQRQLDEARKEPQRHAARLKQQEEVVRGAQKKREAARSHFDWYRSLSKPAGGGGHEEQEAKAAWEMADAAVGYEETRLKELQLYDPSAALARARELIESRQLHLAQVEYEVRQYKVVAPEKGMVLRILVGPGDLWPATGGQPLILFCPDCPRIVRAEVGQDRAARLTASQPVLLQDDEDPAMQWPGEIRRIAELVAPRRNSGMGLQDSLEQPMVECIIEPKLDGRSLRIGQKLRVIDTSSGRK